MTKLSAVAKGKLDKLEGSSNGSTEQVLPARKRGNVNKDLPLAPDEIAGLQEQKRNYTKELQAAAQAQFRPEIDPNHAYPNFERSTTLLLSKPPLFRSVLD